MMTVASFFRTINIAAGSISPFQMLKMKSFARKVMYHVHNSESKD